LSERILAISRDRRVRLGLAILGFAAITFVTYLIAHLRIFVGFAAYDDEGYVLTALRSFVNHSSLYDYVFTQYGPFYYDFWGSLFSIFGIPVNHDAGRTATMVVWIISSLGLGLATWRITRSMLLGLATQMVTFGALIGLISEPMHAGGLVCLLLAVLVSAVSFVRDRASVIAAALLGTAVAALILVKINVGGFAFVSLALACVVSYPALVSRRWIRPLVESAFVLLPLVLLSSKYSEAWARHYAVHVAIAALAVVIALRARPVDRRPNEELGWIAGSLIAVGLASCLAIIGSGTSIGALIDGVVKQPLHQGEAFTLPLYLPDSTYALDALALAGAVGYWYAARDHGREPSAAWIALTSAFGLVIGLELALAVIGEAFPIEVINAQGLPFALMAFAWVALIPTRGRPDPARSFARLLLPPLAVLQALHAFPVAGSQTLWSTFLLIPVGAICIANGSRGIASILPPGFERRAATLTGAFAALVLLVYLANVALREPLKEARAVYKAAVALDLPGATKVRVGEPERQLYQEVTAAINRSCPAFLELPGMDSFYIWTGQEPPTGYNATAWPTLFDEKHERKVIEQTREIEGLCLLRNLTLAKGWSGGVIPPGPLVHYLRQGFQPIGQFGEYELLKREGIGTS
jgi:hypothetical protein